MHMTSIRLKVVNNPATVFLFPYFFEWEAKKDVRSKNITRTLEGVAGVGGRNDEEVGRGERSLSGLWLGSLRNHDDDAEDNVG